MFGKIIERYCWNCDETIQSRISARYIIGEEEYYDLCYCPKCKNDLAEEDRRIIKKTVADKKEIIIIRY